MRVGDPLTDHETNEQGGEKMAGEQKAALIKEIEAGKSAPGNNSLNKNKGRENIPKKRADRERSLGGVVVKNNHLSSDQSD